MKTIKAVLVDDEISNLKGLRLKLEKLFSEIEIAGCYQKPEEAIEAINTQNFDILFLDIQMPRINGFELLSKIKNINFQVIFVTAYSEYAIEAFKKSAIDYILKPIDNEDLSNAVNKALEVITTQQENENNLKLVGFLSDTITQNKKLIVPTVKGISFIELTDILYLEGYKGYTKIHLSNAEVMTSSYNLGKFEGQLNTTFFKSHKSHIVNLNYVKRFENEGYIILKNELRIPIAKQNKKEFLTLMSNNI